MTIRAREKKSRFVYVLCLLAALLVWPAQRFIETNSGGDAEDPDILLFSSPELVKRMALGYSNLLAHLYWMRTVQYHGNLERAERRAVRYKNMYALLDITTTLDPHYLDAYRFGSFFLSEGHPLGADQPEAALKLLEKGIRYNPLEWRLFFDKGFVYYWHLLDFKSAGEIWLQATDIPEAPDFLTGLVAFSMMRGGEMAVAIALWQDRYLTAAREAERDTAKNRLLSFKVAQDIWGWQALAEKYREENGAFPKSLEVLAAEHGLRYSLVDPLGAPYWYDPQTGEAALSDDTEFQYLEVPDIYRDTLVEAAPLVNLLPYI